VRVVPPSRCNSSNLQNLQVPKAPHVPVDTIQNIRSPSIRVKVRIVCHGRKIDAHAILNSGAEGVYCNISFINAHKIPTITLAKPVYPRNVDGTMNKQGPIRHTAILRMEMGEEHKETTEMAMTNIGRHDILLGTDWFRAHNPQIDWAKNQLRLDRCPTSCYPNTLDKTSELAQLLPTEELEAHYDDLLESNYQGIDPTQCIMAHLHGEYNDMISELVVLPTMSPSKKSIVASQRNMAKYEPVVTPTVSITRRHRPVVMPTVPSKTVSRHASPHYGLVVTPTVPSKTASQHASPRYRPVVIPMVPSKAASRNASPRYGLVVTSTVPPKSASWHATPQPTTASQHAPIQAEPVVSPTVSYMCANWHALNYPELVVGRTTVSTTLAKAEQPKNVEIPPKFHQYDKVFSDEEAQRLPKHQLWDHKIDLIPGMEMKKTTVYRLTPIEKVALKEYIEDGLKRGTLR